MPVFTDGSCIDGRTVCAVFLPNEVAKYRLLDNASILLQNFTPFINPFYAFKYQPYMTSSSTLIP
jgi:hypothetical protein